MGRLPEGGGRETCPSAKLVLHMSLATWHVALCKLAPDALADELQKQGHAPPPGPLSASVHQRRISATTRHPCRLLASIRTPTPHQSATIRYPCKHLLADTNLMPCLAPASPPDRCPLSCLMPHPLHASLQRHPPPLTGWDPHPTPLRPRGQLSASPKRATCLCCTQHTPARAFRTQLPHACISASQLPAGFGAGAARQRRLRQQTRLLIVHASLSVLAEWQAAGYATDN